MEGQKRGRGRPRKNTNIDNKINSDTGDSGKSDKKNKKSKRDNDEQYSTDRKKQNLYKSSKKTRDSDFLLDSDNVSNSNNSDTANNSDAIRSKSKKNKISKNEKSAKAAKAAKTAKAAQIDKKKSKNATFSRKLEEPSSKLFLYLLGSDSDKDDVMNGNNTDVNTDANTDVNTDINTDINTDTRGSNNTNNKKFVTDTDDNFNEHSNDNSNEYKSGNDKKRIATLSERVSEVDTEKMWYGNDSDDSDSDSVYTDIDDDKNEDILPIDYSQFNTKDHDVLLLLKHIRRRDAIIAKLTKEISGPRRRVATGKINPLQSIRGVSKGNNIEYHCTIRDCDNNNLIIPGPTDLDCWWCDHGFDTNPIYIPQMYRDDTYYVFGNFCSFNCAYKYNSELTDSKTRTRKALLSNLKDKMLGVDYEVKLADKRELLKSKGGPMSIEEFREGFLPSAKSIEMDIPPMIPMTHVIKYN